jgi:hypothetical protein
MYVEDEHGERPETDADGNDRATEFVPYAENEMDRLEFQIVDITVKQRRQLRFQMENVLRSKSLSVVHGADVEAFFAHLVKTFVRGVRYKETGVELKGPEMVSFMDETFEAEDFYALLSTIGREAELDGPKKKNWSSRFGSPTS